MNEQFRVNAVPDRLNVRGRQHEWNQLQWTDVEARLHCAFDALSHYDRRLLEYEANERTICARLAMHLQAVFPGYDVDVEYNRYGMDPKTVEMNPEPDETRIYPDLIVHRRGSQESNLLVMEVKKCTNSEPREYDRTKLEHCVMKFGYEFAVLVEIPVGVGMTVAGCRPSIERVTASPTDSL